MVVSSVINVEWNIIYRFLGLGKLSAQIVIVARNILYRIMMRLGKFDSLLTPLPMKSPYDDPAILHEISSELDVTLQESEVQ